jgi:hypothetical protein
MSVIGDIILFTLGALLVGGVLLSAIRTVVLPHAGSVRLTRAVFGGTRRMARGYSRLDRSPQRRHGAMQLSVAVSLLLLPTIWLSIALGGYTLMFKGLGTATWRASYELSGSSLFTLGFAKPEDLPRLTLMFSASALAISILALLLVTYLPTIYQAYTSREAFLTSFETIAGAPPNVAAMIIRSHQLGSLDRLSVIWMGWREWFAELRESHTALPAVPFLGSSRNDRNWVATVGTFLDAAAVSLAVLDHESDSTDSRTNAALCIRAGSLALRDIAEYFDIEVDKNPQPTDPISINRDSFDAAYDQLVDAGVPVNDRDQAWLAWAGWRVNYDAPLVALAELTASPTTRLTSGGPMARLPEDHPGHGTPAESN